MTTVKATVADPKLPEPIDVVLICDTLQQWPHAGQSAER
jgi:hypothetical protein